MVDTRVDPEDSGYFVSADYEGKGKGVGWAANGIFARIGKVDTAGHWVWEAGDKAKGFVKPGQFCKPGHFAGVVKGGLFITDWNGDVLIIRMTTNPGLKFPPRASGEQPGDLTKRVLVQ